MNRNVRPGDIYAIYKKYSLEPDLYFVVWNMDSDTFMCVQGLPVKIKKQNEANPSPIKESNYFQEKKQKFYVLEDYEDNKLKFKTAITLENLFNFNDRMEEIANTGILQSVKFFGKLGPIDYIFMLSQLYMHNRMQNKAHTKMHKDIEEFLTEWYQEASEDEDLPNINPKLKEIVTWFNNHLTKH